MKQRAEISLIGDLFQQSDAVLHWDLQVGLPKKGSVRQTGSEHPLVSSLNLPGMGPVRIHHRQEFGEQLPLALMKRKILLMLTHHRDEDLPRELQELLVKVPAHHTGMLAQVGHCLQQRSVLDQIAALLNRCRLQICLDPMQPRHRIDFHLSLSKFLPILVETPHHRFTVAGQNSMPEGAVAGPDGGQLNG